MKKLGFFVAMALSAVTLFTSCLGEGTNQTSGAICGVYFLNPSAGYLPMIDTGSGYIYVPELQTYNDGDCLGMGIMIDYNDPANADYSTKGYMTASLTSEPVNIDKWRSAPIIAASDTASLMENEIVLNNAFTGNGYSGYARGYLFIPSNAKIGSRQVVDWHLSYPRELEPVVKNGENHYQFFVRATAEGEDTGAGNQDVNNAYYVQSAFEMINKKEADANKTVLYLDFNYVRGIDQTTNKPIWASTTVMYYVMATED